LDDTKLGSASIAFFCVPSREEVDRVHARMTAAGHRSQKAPEDAFWGARYAIVEDPDGNSVGITSPIDESMRSPPPPPPRERFPAASAMVSRWRPWLARAASRSLYSSNF